MICNILTNPNHPNAAIFKASWDTAPERVKKYHADFCADMKPYLDNRPKDYMVWKVKSIIYDSCWYFGYANYPISFWDQGYCRLDQTLFEKKKLIYIKYNGQINVWDRRLNFVMKRITRNFYNKSVKSPFSFISTLLVYSLNDCSQHFISLYCFL